MRRPAAVGGRVLPASSTTAGTHTHPAAQVSANRRNGNGIGAPEDVARRQYIHVPTVPASAPSVT